MDANIKKNTQLAGQVRKLAQRHLNRALGYQQAMSLTKDPAIKAILEQGVQQSYYFAEHLQSAMSLQGMTSNAKPSWSGTLFRAYMVLSVRLSNRKSYRLIRYLLSSEKMLHLSYKLLCDNRYLQYAYPLLRSTFLKQYFIIKDYMGVLEDTLGGLEGNAGIVELEGRQDAQQQVDVDNSSILPATQEQSEVSLAKKILNVIPDVPTVNFQ